LDFPETVKTKLPNGATAQVASGQRYMLLKQDGIALNTTLSVGAEIMDRVRVGAGFIWGVASYRLANANMSVSPVQQADGSWLDRPTGDVRAELTVADWFIPGVTVGVLVSPLDTLDVGLNVIAQEAFDAHGDLETKANYWTDNGVSNNSVTSSSADVEKDLGHVRIATPLEARVGARFHVPRGDAKDDTVRDPLADDLFDVELDVSYTRNSAYKAATLRFPASPVVPVQGTPGAVPQNNDVDFKVKRDTVGFRLGGDFVVLPSQLAVRAGGWWEPDVQNEQYANVAFLASQRVGVAVGGTYRLDFVDIDVGYQHVFFATVDNHGDGKLLVVSGDASAGNRSPYGINGGRFTQSANIFSIGGTARF
jgi:long-chain fatty acid transport protein